MSNGDIALYAWVAFGSFALIYYYSYFWYWVGKEQGESNGYWTGIKRGQEMAAENKMSASTRKARK